MSNQETIYQVLSTHPNVFHLHTYDEDERFYGRIEFFYRNDKEEKEIVILFSCDDPLEIQVREKQKNSWQISKSML